MVLIPRVTILRGDYHEAAPSDSDSLDLEGERREIAKAFGEIHGDPPWKAFLYDSGDPAAAAVVMS